MQQEKDDNALPLQARRELGEDIAFGLQQTLTCMSTDFIDPYIGKWMQDRFKDVRHNGSLKHTWGGEIVGDGAAFFAFLGIERYLPRQSQWLKSASRHALAPVLDSLGRKSLAPWARQAHEDENSAEYAKHLERWKDFEADSFAKSAEITVTSIIGNVVTQKAMGNTHKLAVITASKIAGAAITMGAMLTLRLGIPNTTRMLDQELSDKYFAPVIRKAQHLLGAHANGHESHAAKLERDTAVTQAKTR